MALALLHSVITFIFYAVNAFHTSLYFLTCLFPHSLELQGPTTVMKWAWHICHSELLIWILTRFVFKKIYILQYYQKSVSFFVELFKPYLLYCHMLHKRNYSTIKFVSSTILDDVLHPDGIWKHKLYDDSMMHRIDELSRCAADCVNKCSWK